MERILVAINEENGIKFYALRRKMGCSTSTLFDRMKELVQMGLVKDVNGRYYSIIKPEDFLPHIAMEIKLELKRRDRKGVKLDSDKQKRSLHDIIHGVHERYFRERLDSDPIFKKAVARSLADVKRYLDEHSGDVDELLKPHSDAIARLMSLIIKERA